MNKIRVAVNMTGESYSDENVFANIADMVEEVYIKKLDILEKNGNVLDLVVEKERADKYFSMFKERKPDKNSAKVKFMYKLYMLLEDYEKLIVLNDL